MEIQRKNALDLRKLERLEKVESFKEILRQRRSLKNQSPDKGIVEARRS